MFYAGSAQSLRSQIEECFKHEFGPGALPKVSSEPLNKIVGLICPHAGYMYSGPIAANAYYNLALDGKPDLVVLLGPNHTGIGSGLAVMRNCLWRTPLGDVEIDTPTADALVRESHIIDADDNAHMSEHCIEVQLPWLQYLYGSDFKFLPICFLMQDLESSMEVGEAVARIVKGEKNALIVASTDLTHYEPQKTAERKDKAAIDVMLKMDERELYSTVEKLNISMCGYGPTIAAITAVKALGANQGKLLCYKTSGDITKDYSAVVGYASIMFTK
jgi:hypothetical protein